MESEPTETTEETPDDEKGGYSATIGMVLAIVVAVGLVWHDRRTVDSVLATHTVVTQTEEQISGFSSAAPEDAVLVSIRAEMDKVLAARGGAECSPLFDLLGRRETVRGARSNMGAALAIQAETLLLSGDIDAAAKAAQQFEKETSDDLLPSKVDAWVWRITEISDHPESRKLSKARLRAVFFADMPVDEAIKAN